jgi:iron complex transport system ATP-binding protein
MDKLSIRRLHIAYGQRSVLDDVTLQPLQAGQIVALLGPNAAGKSTLQKAIAGLAASTGELHLGDIDLRSLPRRERLQRIGYLPQALPQPSGLLVYEALYSGLRAGCPELSATDVETAVSDTVHDFGLGALSLRRLDELSGGQRQMVGLAQVIARKPRVLLLDEPTSALDLRWQLQVIQSVQRLAQQNGLICIIAVHDLNLALRFCDRIVVLGQGRVLADGPPDALTPQLLEAAWGVHGRVETCSLGYRTVLVDATRV